MNNIRIEDYEIRFEDKYCIVKDTKNVVYFRINGSAYKYVLEHYKDTDFYIKIEKILRGKRNNKKVSFVKFHYKNRLDGVVEKIPSFVFDYRFVLFVIGVYTVFGSVALFHSIYGDVYSEKSGWIYVLMLIVNIFFHEVGHIIFCLHAGRQINSYGFKLNYGIPMFYVDTSDICMASKKDRIMTSLGGVYLNSLIGLMTVAKNFVLCGGIGKDALTLIPYFFVISNLLPFMKLDGYYILSDLIEVGNLNKSAKKNICRTQRNVGLDERKKGFLFGYYIASVLFCSIVILRIVYTFLNWIIA